MAGFATSGVLQCVVITCQIRKYIPVATSPVQSFNNPNRFIDRRFCLLFGAKSLYFENKKRDEFNLPCNFDLGLGGFSFAQISPLLWSFSRFWSSFIKIKVLNEEENSVLHILYCYSLQQHIFLAFCNDFDTHHRMFAYTLFRNKILLFSK